MESNRKYTPKRLESRKKHRGVRIGLGASVKILVLVALYIVSAVIPAYSIEEITRDKYEQTVLVDAMKPAVAKQGPVMLSAEIIDVTDELKELKEIEPDAQEETIIDINEVDHPEPVVDKEESQELKLIDSKTPVCYVYDAYNYDEYKALSIEEKEQLLVANNYYGYSEEDYNYLVMTLAGECLDCSLDWQLSSASVVLNIMANDYYFPNCDTIKDVVTDENKYDCFANGRAYRTPNNTNKEAAMEVLRYGSILPTSVIYQTFNSNSGDGVYTQFGNVYFCYKL